MPLLRAGIGLLLPLAVILIGLPCYAALLARSPLSAGRSATVSNSDESHRIACGRNRDVLPVIGFPSSRTDRPHGV